MAVLTRVATCFLVALLACGFSSSTLQAAKVKGAKLYKPYDPIVLEATEVSSGKAQYLWDVDGGAQTVEKGGTLYVWAAPGTYKVKLTAIDFDAKKIERATFTFTVDGTPTPGPGPGPDPPGPGPKPPGPTPSPAPIPVDGFRVLIVEESSERGKLPAAQANIILNKSLRDYLNSVCVPEGKQKGWWILDKDVDTSALASHWQAAMKRPRASVPWIVISNGKTGYEGPLPANVAATLELVKKYVPAARPATKGSRR